MTNVDQCKKWTRLTEVRRTAIPGGRGARAHGYDLAKANLTVAGRLVIQNNVTVLLRVTPSKQLISPLANDTYVPQDKSAALYILDSRTPFAGRAGFGCVSNQCCMGGGSMMCATSADHKLRMASKAVGVERWYDNGNAEQGPCSFGQSVSFVHESSIDFGFDACCYSTSPPPTLYVPPLCPCSHMVTWQCGMYVLHLLVMQLIRPSELNLWQCMGMLKLPGGGTSSLVTSFEHHMLKKLIF